MSSEDEFPIEDDEDVQMPSIQDLQKRKESIDQSQDLSERDREIAAIVSRKRKEEQKEQASDEEEEEEEEDQDSAPPSAFELRRKLMIKRRRAIYQKLTPEQRDRFEMYLKGSFARSNIKRVMISVLGTSKVADQLAVVMAGIAKVFAGDVVEQSLLVMSEWGDSGKIRPVHMREAYRRLKAQGLVPSAQPKRLFRL
jgi:transcription initiation factor TFIID subunit 11